MPLNRQLPSLKARALACLARREHSRLELEKKLQPHAESAEQLQQLLDALEAKNLLSAQRYADSLIHRKASRFGAQRILAEMKQQGLDETIRATSATVLQATELQRATEVWQKRFGVVPQDWREKTKQAAFLQRRGFSLSVIRQVLKDAELPGVE
ncbi:MAG: recombination regulator RecX [Burkholderiaceae bacterium]|nr:MAG: recombination regulator RecX [Burkholderiaceae bacterium]